ncbi:thiamine pyrophosphate-binding protein [Chloroflexota bacterium]
MAKVNGGRLVIEGLKQEGLKYLFTLSGNQIEPILDAVIDSGIKLIDVRHEQAAVHMADAMARLTGEPSAVTVTAGPGIANTIPGMAVAYHSASPVLLVTGQASFAEADTSQLQETPQVSLMEPVTKWAGTCRQTGRIPEYISIAFRHACSGRKGPVFLEIPNDIMDADVEEEKVTYPIKYRTDSRPQGQKEQIDEAVDILLNAERPVVLAGGGVWWSRASMELIKFIESFNIPLILSSGMARGLVPEDHPLYVGSVKVVGAPRVITREADVVLSLGARLNGWKSRGRPPVFRMDQKWIQVDIDPLEIGRNRPVEVGILGDIQMVLKQMIGVLNSKGKERSDQSWVKKCQEVAAARWETAQQVPQSTSGLIHPLHLCKGIREYLNKDAVIVVDGGDIAEFAVDSLRSYHPGHWLDASGLGMIGAGIPFGIGSKLAKPDKQVLVLTGDGSFGFNCMEFDTAIRHNIPVVVVVANDAAWGMVKHAQEGIRGFDRVIGSELRLTRYDKVVEALGGHGAYVEKPEELAPALEKAFASGLPACINVKVDPTIASPLTASVVKWRLSTKSST